MTNETKCTCTKKLQIKNKKAYVMLILINIFKLEFIIDIIIKNYMLSNYFQIQKSLLSLIVKIIYIK